MKKTIILMALVLFMVNIAAAQQFKVDDTNRVVVLDLVKGASMTFTFYGDLYTVELGSFDFEKNRVTLEMHPKLGTDIVNLNTATNWDLDADEEDDIAFTLISLDPNKGTNEKGEIGTGRIRIESLKQITLEKTTITTSVKAETTAETTVAATTGGTTGGNGSADNTTVWIIAGISVGVIVILFLLKDKIMGAFKKTGGPAAPMGGAGMATQQQNLPNNYKSGGKPNAGGSKCVKCGKDLAPGAKFCNNCGAKAVAAETKKFCPECGTEFKGGRFCQSCGHKMM